MCDSNVSSLSFSGPDYLGENYSEFDEFRNLDERIDEIRRSILAVNVRSDCNLAHILSIVDHDRGQVNILFINKDIKLK